MATAREINAALYWHFTPRYAVLTEITTDDPGTAEYMVARAKAIGRHVAAGGDAWAAPLPEPPAAWSRRVDVLLVSGQERIAVEVKVSRADFLADVRNPEKQAAWKALAHRHAWACPAGLIRPDEVPADSGLIYVAFREHIPAIVGWEKRAPKWNVPDDLPGRVTNAIMHRCARAEAHAKGLLPGETEDPEALRLALQRARRDLEIEQGRNDRLRTAASEWRKALALHGDPPCAACAEPIKPRWSGRYGMSWTHRDPEQEDACLALRRAAYAAENPSATYRHADPVEPADLAAVLRG